MRSSPLLPSGLAIGLLLTVLLVCLAAVIQADIAISRDPAAYIMVDRHFILGDLLPGGTVKRILDPFILSNYLLYVPAALLTLVGLPAELAHKLVCFTLFGWSFVPLWRLVAAHPGRFAWVMLPLYAFVGLVFPVDGFGQKEHLFLLLLLPYVLAALTPGQRLGWGAALAAACALAIKPYLIGPWILIEAWRAVRDGWRALLCRHNAVILIVQLLYYSAVAVLVLRLPDSPDAIAATLELKRAFMRVDIITMLVRRYSLIWLVGVTALTAAVIFVPWLRRGGLVWLLLIAGALASVVAQGAGLDYHWHLVASAAGLGLAWMVAESGPRPLAALGALVLFVALAAVRTIPFATMERTYRDTFLTELVAAAQAHPGHALAIFSADYRPQNEILAMTGLGNALGFESEWFMDGIAARQEEPMMRSLLDRTAAEVAIDLARPGVQVYVPDSPSAGLALLLAHPVVATALSHYRLDSAVAGYRILVPAP